jgi:hypothetical protein
MLEYLDASARQKLTPPSPRLGVVTSMHANHEHFDRRFVALMFTVHATKKLLDRLKVKAHPAPPEPTTQLGSWYATALFWKPQVVLFVNEPTLLPILVPLAPAATVIDRFPGFVAEMLHELGIPQTIIDTELAAMNEHVVAKTANRSVVGMLNEFSFLGERFLDPGTDLLMLSLRLADVPCGPLYKSTSYPNSEVRLRLLGETPEWVKRKEADAEARSSNQDSRIPKTTKEAGPLHKS